MHPLIDVPTLAVELAGQRPPTLLDVRWRLAGPPGIDDYRAGHLPGAVFVDLDRDLAGEPGPEGRHPLPSTEAFQTAMRASGVWTDSNVVVYDAGDGVAAARAWWLAAVLRAWTRSRARRRLPRLACGRASGGHRGAARRAGRFRCHSWRHAGPRRAGGAPGRTGRRASRRARSRTLPRRGRADGPRGWARAGAINAPSGDNLDEEGRFLHPDTLRARFRALGADGGREVGAYCGSGVTAAHEVLALEVAGIPAQLYVGSWSNWVADTSRPVETGER